MKSFKETIPDDTVLAAKFAVVLNSGLPDFLKSTYAERATIRSRQYYVLIAGLFFIGTVMMLYFLDIGFVTWTDRLILLIAFCWSIVLLLSGRSWFMSSRLLSREMNMAMTPLILNTIDAMMLYTHTEDTPDSVTGEIKSLLHYSDVSVVSKDRYQVFLDPAVQFDEVQIVKKSHPIFSTLGTNELGSGVLVTTAAPEECHGVMFASAGTHTLIDTVWDNAGAGKYIPEKSLDHTRVYLNDAAQEQILEKYDLPELFEFLHTYHTGEYIAAVADGELQLLLLGDSLRVPLGSTSTDRTVVAWRGFRIILPIWKGLRVAETFKTVV